MQTNLEQDPSTLNAPKVYFDAEEDFNEGTVL